MDVPGGGAVAVEDVKVLARQQLAAVDARLNGAEAAKDANLLHVAHQRNDVESLQLGVDGVEAADEVLEEQLEGLRQTEHRLALNHESGDFLTAIVDELALVGGGIGAADRRWAVVGARRNVMVGGRHQVEGTSVVHEGVEQTETVRRKMREALRHSRLHAHQAARR